MRIWMALGLTSAAASVLTLGAAAIVGLLLLVALNGFSEADAGPAIIAYVVAALGGNVVVVSLANRAAASKFYPHAGAGLGTAVAAAAVVTLLFALVPLVRLGINILWARAGRA
jgi:hypothetical protein